MVGVFLRGVVALLLILMPLNLSPVFGSTGYSEEVIVEFEPAAGGLLPAVDSRLAMLHGMGYDFETIEILQNVMHGAVIRIASDQVAKLRGEDMVRNVHAEKFMSANLDKSVKLIDADRIVSLDSQGRTITGEGVRIGVIDTGVDYTHYDLLGFGEGGKVVGGYDFLGNDDQPMDTDGHGTMVAGIIAADGEAKGVAPGAKLLAYRVASEDSYVSTIDMVRALERAVGDEVDIINISLGLDYISEEIDRAVENVVRHGIVVVTAVGNNGESGRPIGSPASAQNSISVGASLNNVTSNLVSTLRIGGDSTGYDVIPMMGSPLAEEPVASRLVYANFAREVDVRDLGLSGAIVLAERGGPLIQVRGIEQVELVYFSEKEHNVAGGGAAALIVYNNMPGMFYGKLVHDENAPDYEPSIPVVSVSREEGLCIKELIESSGGGDLAAEIRVFHNSEPDMMAPFSSKGPVSPFYMKPDLVAPGAFINSTTLENAYDVTSGTSFAAPHVAGAAALLLQKNHELEPAEVASILSTAADPVRDLYGVPYSYEIAGVGRLNVTSAIESNIIAVPHYAVMHLSSAAVEASRTIELRAIEGVLGDLDLSMEWNDPDFGGMVSLNAAVERGG
ncbi:MAG: S8 family serine peptidase, partial [Nitrososphaerales archaeon]